MIYWRANHCPRCDKDLTDVYSKYEEPIADGFLCPYCRATLGYKRIYPLIGLVLLALGAITVTVSFGCILSQFLSLDIAYLDSACSRLDNNLVYVGGALLSMGMFLGSYNNSYVIK